MSDLKVDKRLNIAFPVGATGLQVHSAPISRDVFERYWAPITKAFNFAVSTAGISAPRIASLALRESAEQLGVWTDQKNATGDVTRNGVESGLLAEIKRLTSVVVHTPEHGWQAVPLDVARQQKKLDADEYAEVENAIVFFTLASWVPSKGDLPGIYESGFSIADARVTSSNSTEWAHSLRTSTATEDSGKKKEPAASSHPS